MNRCRYFVAALVFSLGAFVQSTEAGGRFVYHGRTVMRGPAAMGYGYPVVNAPSSIYAYPTAAQYLMSPIYNPVQHPLMPVYGGWAVSPGYIAPMAEAPYDPYLTPFEYGYGW